MHTYNPHGISRDANGQGLYCTLPISAAELSTATAYQIAAKIPQSSYAPQVFRQVILPIKHAPVVSMIATLTGSLDASNEKPVSSINISTGAFNAVGGEITSITSVSGSDIVSILERDGSVTVSTTTEGEHPLSITVTDGVNKVTTQGVWSVSYLDPEIKKIDNASTHITLASDKTEKAVSYKNFVTVKYANQVSVSTDDDTHAKVNNDTITFDETGVYVVTITALNTKATPPKEIKETVTISVD